MKKQDSCFKTKACGKWHASVGAGQRPRKNTFTNKHKYVALLHVPFLSPHGSSYLPSPTKQAGACGLQVFDHPLRSNTD